MDSVKEETGECLVHVADVVDFRLMRLTLQFSGVTLNGVHLGGVLGYSWCWSRENKRDFGKTLCTGGSATKRYPSGPKPDLIFWLHLVIILSAFNSVCSEGHPSMGCNLLTRNAATMSATDVKEYCQTAMLMKEKCSYNCWT